MEISHAAQDSGRDNGPSYEVKFGKTLLENWVEEVNTISVYHLYRAGR